MDEFQLIKTFFQRSYSTKQIICGSGDDAACLRPSSGHILCVSTDTFVEGVHFLSDWPADIIAKKLVTVNVSDIAAMAAIPKWVSLAMTLPKVDEAWLQGFSSGLFAELDAQGIALIGGDVTRGPLTLTMTIHGECLAEEATYRHGATVGEVIYVTGPLGAPSLAVDCLTDPCDNAHTQAYLMEKLQQPKARTDCRLLIGRYANACIDISDGLVGDLGHICQQSRLGATLIAEQIPIDSVVNRYCPEQALAYALHGGDEYQLCFTINRDRQGDVESFAKLHGLSIYPIGHMIQRNEVNLLVDGEPSLIASKAYKHFK